MPKDVRVKKLLEVAREAGTRAEREKTLVPVLQQGIRLCRQSPGGFRNECVLFQLKLSGPRANPHRRTPVFLPVLPEGICQSRESSVSREDPHWRETLLVPILPQNLYTSMISRCPRQVSEIIYLEISADCPRVDSLGSQALCQPGFDHWHSPVVDFRSGRELRMHVLPQTLPVR